MYFLDHQSRKLNISNSLYKMLQLAGFSWAQLARAFTRVITDPHTYVLLAHVIRCMAPYID